MKYTLEQLQDKDYDNIVGVSINNYYYTIDFIDNELGDVVLYEIEYADSRQTRQVILYEMTFNDLLDKDVIFYELKEVA